MRLSANELETLRTRPVQSTLDLFIFSPRVVLKCRLNNASAAKNDISIPFDTVSSGSVSAVESGMTLLVGTQEGKSDVGKIRIRSVSGGNTFIVSENSNIRWQDNLYLTVIRYWDLWPVFPRIIQDPSNDENVIFYKDYDVPYSTQNFTLGTFVNAGPHRPVFIDNGTGTVYYSSTGTLNLLGNSLSYNWAFEGGSPTGSTSANPGNVYYTTPGDYVTRLIVTDSSNGNSDTTYRYVSVKNRIGEGGTTPIVRWELNSLSGSRDEGGYTASFRVYDTVDINDNCLVMLKLSSLWGDTNTKLGGNYPSSGDVFFVGYIERGSIRYNYSDSYIEFSAISVTGMMKKTTGFSVSVESKSNPSTWYELRDMDCRRAMYHYLKWHSTVLSVTDFSFVGDDRKIQFYDVDRTSVFDAIDNLMKSALFGRVSSDRQGRIWADVDPLAYSNPTGTFTPVMNITTRDWVDEPTIDEMVYDQTSYVEVGGVAYSGAITGTFDALLSGAPGYSPSFHGAVEKLSGFALTSQTQLNQLSGNIWANRNQRFPRISMNMSQPMVNLDIAPQEVVGIHVGATDTIRNEEIDGIYIPSSMSWNYSSANKNLRTTMELIGLVSGVPGDTILIPPVVEDGDYSFPEFSFPSFPPFALPSFPIINPLSIDNLAIHISGYGIFYTTDLSSPSPSWVCANTNLEANKAAFKNFEVGSGGLAVIQNGTDEVWGVSALGGEWTRILSKDDVGNPEGFAFPRGHYIAGFGLDRDSGNIIILAGLVVTIFSTNIFYPYIGNIGGVTRTKDTYISDQQGGAYTTYVHKLSNGNWFVTYTTPTNTPSWAIFSADGTTTVAFGDFTGATHSPVHTKNRFTGNVLVSKNKNDATGVKYLLSTNSGVTFNPITGGFIPEQNPIANEDYFESVITNADGTQIVVGSDTGVQGLAYSLNGGATWTTGAFGITNVTSVWGVAPNAYAIAANSAVYLLSDIMATGTLVNKTGNLYNLISGSFSILAMRHW